MLEAKMRVVKMIGVLYTDFFFWALGTTE